MLQCIQPVAAVCTAIPLQVTALAAVVATYTETSRNTPAKIETIAGAELSRVPLTPKAAQRLDIHTDQVSEDSSDRTITPDTSLLHDCAGEICFYTNLKPLTFVRHKIVVEAVKGENVYLKNGPLAGAKVVTVGASALYGAEKALATNLNYERPRP